MTNHCAKKGHLVGGTQGCLSVANIGSIQPIMVKHNIHTKTEEFIPILDIKEFLNLKNFISLSLNSLEQLLWTYRLTNYVEKHLIVS